MYILCICIYIYIIYIIRLRYEGRKHKQLHAWTLGPMPSVSCMRAVVLLQPASFLVPMPGS